MRRAPRGDPPDSRTDEGARPAPDPPRAPLPDAEAVARLVAASPWRSGRGPIAWLWLLAAPLAMVAAVFALAYGDRGGLLVCLGILITARRLNALTTELAHTRKALLAAEMDETWVPALVDALDWPERSVREVARLRLCALLPRLGEGAGRGLSDAQRATLGTFLTPRRAAAHPGFVAAILQALPVIGDPAAPPHVERLSRLPALWPGMRRVRSAALACLAPLERRIAEDRMRGGESDGRKATPDLREAAPSAAGPDQAPQEGSGERPCIRLAFLAAGWGFVVPGGAYVCITNLLEGRPVLGAVFGAVALLGTQLYRLTLTPRHIRLVRDLASTDDVRNVGRLAEALDWPDNRARALAAGALVRLLPRMRASDAGLLSADQRVSLYRQLTPARARTHAALLVALLKALEQVGDNAALAHVRPLAQMRGASAREQQVRAAAQECLPFLEERAEHDRHSSLLVRASSGGADHAEVLVRPAGPGGEAGGDQLVRPAAPREG